MAEASFSSSKGGNGPCAAFERTALGVRGEGSANPRRLRPQSAMAKPSKRSSRAGFKDIGQTTEEKTVRMELYAATNTNSVANATAEIMEYLRQSQNRANSLRANKQEKLNLSHFDFLKQSDMHLGMWSETAPTHSGG